MLTSPWAPKGRSYGPWLSGCASILWKGERLQLVNSWATYPRCQMKKKHPIQLYFGFRCMESWRHHKLVILTEVQSRNKRMTKNGREEGQARTSRHQYPPSIFLSIIKLVFATFFFIQQVASLVKPKARRMVPNQIGEIMSVRFYDRYTYTLACSYAQLWNLKPMTPRLARSC